MKKGCVPHGCRVWLALFAAGGMAWATPAADWAGDDVTLGANDAQERVEVPSEASGKTFKTLTVAGDYALTGASWLKVETLSVPTGGRLTLSPDGVVRTRHLRLTLKGHPSAGEGVNTPNGIALAEIALSQNGARIPWPEGTAILASEYADYAGQGHSDDDLIDGDLGTKWFWDKAPADGECTITLDAPEGGRFVFDGYTLAMADQNGRNPLTWELAVSEDGETWEPLDCRDPGLEAILALPTNNWMGEEPLAVEPKDAATNGFLIEAGTAEIAGTLAGAGRLVGSVAFAEGATLEVAEGHHPTIVGTATGAPRLDVPEGLLSQTTNLPVIAAPEGLTPIAPEGYKTAYEGGVYWLRSALEAPLAATIAGEAEWAEAGWQDAGQSAVSPEFWDLPQAAGMAATLTAGAEGGTLALREATTRVGALTIGASEGTLALKGPDATFGVGRLEAASATVAGTLSLPAPTVSARYVRLTPTATVVGGRNNKGIAIAEFQLLLGGQPVAWEGATIQASWGEAYAGASDDALIDGNPGTKWFWETAKDEPWEPEFEGCTLTLDAGEGKTLTFDGYRLAMADRNGRNPRRWTLEVSADGQTWHTLDAQDFPSEEALLWPHEAWMGQAFAPLAPVTLALGEEGMTVTETGTLAGGGVIAGDVTFEEGSALAPDGRSAPTVTGAVSGTVALTVGQDLLDATPIVPTLRAAKGSLAFTGIPEGYEVRHANGVYWLAPTLGRAFTATLAGETAWTEAGWRDAEGRAVEPEAWKTLDPAETTLTVTAAEDATLRPENGPAGRLGALTVADSGHTLTLAGGDWFMPHALTVEGAVASDSTVLRLTEATTLAGTLTYSIDDGINETLPLLGGKGTLTKIGVGTLQLPTSTTGGPTIVTREGTLSLHEAGEYTAIPHLVAEGTGVVQLTGASLSVTDTAATLTLRNGGILRLNNGADGAQRRFDAQIRVANDGTDGSAAHIQGAANGERASLCGGITGHGLLVFDAGASKLYSLDCPIAEEGGTLRLRFADAGNRIHVNKPGTHTGGTVIASEVRVADAEAFGRGDVTIEAGGTLTLDGVSLNVREAFANSGTVAGTVNLCGGASLTVGTATFDTLSVEPGAAIPLTLPESVHPASCLIDGDLTSKWFWETAETVYDDLTLTIDLGEGNAPTFDGYQLAMGDVPNRNPVAWTLEVSADGQTWTTVDTQRVSAEEALAWPTYAWMPQTLGVPAPLPIVVEQGMTLTGTLAGGGVIAGDVTFGEGATLRPLPGTVPTLVGAVTGTCALDLSALDFPEDGSGLPVLRAAEGVSFTAPEGYKVDYADGLYVVTPDLRLAVAEGAPALTPEQERILLGFARGQGLSGTVRVGFDPAVKDPTWEALQCFEGILSASPEAGTLTVSYAFGIEALAVADGQATVTVRVRGPGGAEAAFAQGVSVTLAEVGADGTLADDALTDAPTVEGGTATFALPLPKGRDTLLFGARASAP